MVSIVTWSCVHTSQWLCRCPFGETLCGLCSIAQLVVKNTVPAILATFVASLNTKGWFALRA